MHGTSQGAPVVLSGMGGLVTLAGSDLVPEGASPRTYDTDFSVGGVKTRSGLSNVISLASESVGPNPGTAAANVAQVGVPWQNPTNILHNVSPATVIPGQIAVTPTMSATNWTNPANATNPTLYATQAGGANELLATVAPFTLPAGASIAGIKVDFVGYTSGYGYSDVKIRVGGVDNGTSFAIPWPVSSGNIEAGSNSDTWGWSSADLAGGFALVFAAPNTGTTYLNNLVITVYITGAYGSDYLEVTGFTFSLPSSSQVTGFTLKVTGHSPGATLFARMIKSGALYGDVKSITLPTSNDTVTLGAPTDPWGGSWLYSDPNATNFGVALWADSSAAGNTVSLLYATLSIGVNTGSANFQFVDTFTLQDGTVKNIYLDASGNLFIENVTTAPGVLSLLQDNIAPNAKVVAQPGPDLLYMAFGDGKSGIDMPLQVAPDWIDRITQVGPGAAPVFTPIQASSNTFAISTITQPAQVSEGYSYFLQSSGPGSTTPGNVITFYYQDSTNGPANADLVAAFNSGYPVYVYASFTGTPVTFGPEVVQVTGIGEASPPGQPRQFYYFTFVVSSSAYTLYSGSGHAGYTATWQRTLATMTMTDPVPGLVVGNDITISGATPSAWDGVWPISQDIDSGAMAITSTNVTSGVATFNYSVQSGAAPAVGQLVTITGTTNANGALNLLNASIDTATGGSSGSFTVLVSTPNYGTVAESGQATTAGTIFAFDPGAPLVGTGTNPIFGNTSVGGSLTFAGPNGQLLAVGTKQGTVFFITRNGYYTAPAPPVTFTVPANTISLVISNIPIGPPNVVARGIAITESGQNGTPGGNFFTIPQPVTYIVNDQSYTANSLFVQDNSTTQVSVFFTDSVLLNALAIDVYGYNLFNQIEIGDPGWITGYSGRQFYGQCLNKVQNFNNLSFDGGYLPASRLAPLGWTQPDAFGSLIVSPKFGDAYYIANNGLTLGITQTAMTSGTATYTYTGLDPAPGDPVTVTGTTNGSGIFNVTGATIATVNTGAKTFTVTGLAGTYAPQAETGSAMVTGTLPAAGLISQTAFQDAYQTAILSPNTAYSVRVTASIPSGLTTGNLVVSLTAGGVVYGTFTLPFAQMTTNLKTYTGTLLTTEFSVVPPTLLLNLEATNLGNGADVLIDRVEPFPTAIPILGTTVYGSYAGLPEQVDAVTGQGKFESENQQPVNSAIVMYDTFYGLKGWAGTAPGSSMYSWQASANLEPAQWSEPEVAQRLGGACGPLAFDLGEQWFVGATRAGAYLFMGGQPGKINHEIYQVWDAINWSAAASIWVLNDEVHRRLMFGVPMPTPNFWLPNAPVNANPTSPNVILMCNYQGLDSGEAIKTEPQMHVTMFGTLNSMDMRRKWSIWQIPSPYAGVVQCGEIGDQAVYICNGRANSEVYRLDDSAATDAGITIDSLYTTAGLVELSKRGQMPGIGSFRLRWGYLVAALQSLGNVAVRLLANRLYYPEPAGYNPWTVPGGFSPGKPAFNDVEAPLNFAATRAFVEFREADGEGFELSNLVLHTKKDPWNAIRGSKT